MNQIHEKINKLNQPIDVKFPNTKRYIISGSDYLKDVIFELRESDKGLRYSPYELFSETDDPDYAITQFLYKWESELQNSG